MNISFQRLSAAASLLEDDDVLPVLQRWRQQGLRTALVTLVGVEGGAPRAPGAQMAVAEDGRYAGYLSGGCLEQAVALEAKDVIARGANRLVRYGKDSPYFDIKLPCGSGLDLYFDQTLRDEDLAALLQLRAERRPSALSMDLKSGLSRVEMLAKTSASSLRASNVFCRVYPAPLRLALLGNGPALVGIATLAQATGLDLAIWTADDATRQQLATLRLSAGSGDGHRDAVMTSLDAASAAVVVFHDHEAEPRVLSALLATPCFYIGVLGNHAVHRTRLEALRLLGTSREQLARLHAPVGAIANAKSKATFAVGVLSELMAEAKARHLVP